MTEFRKVVRVTEAERQKLDETHAFMTKMNEAFFEVPEGSPSDEKPLITGLRIMWRAYQTRRWAGRFLVWLIPTIAGLLIALDQIWEWIKVKL